jgi:hypothetical protein
MKAADERTSVERVGVESRRSSRQVRLGYFAASTPVRDVDQLVHEMRAFATLSAVAIVLLMLWTWLDALKRPAQISFTRRRRDSCM